MSWLSDLKNKINNVSQPDSAQIDALTRMYRLPSQQPLGERISQLQLTQQQLNISFFLYDDEVGDAQKIHDDLASMLTAHGIQAINLHITQKKRAKNQGTLPDTQARAVPKTIDAAALAQSQNSDLDNSKDLGDDAPISKAAPSQQQQKSHPRIAHVLAIASGKGGVGKSTTTVNLALALKQLGLEVGILDADIYGPSIPTMMGNQGQTPLIENGEFVPLEAFAMPVLSIGHLTADARTPIAWRGSKATGALLQLFNQTLWPQLDVLLIDMPPGTGDIQLTLAQRVKIDGAIIVTTPQHVALMDAQKAIELFNKVGIETWGVIENMSTHVCSQCGNEEQIFGSGGGDELAQHYQVPLLGHLPLNSSIRKNADLGTPSVIAQDSAAPSYLKIAEKIKAKLADLPKVYDEKRIF